MAQLLQYDLPSDLKGERSVLVGGDSRILYENGGPSGLTLETDGGV